ncbi:hypothetical protein AOLI_G00039090 [Acnodon oligacanthus]
MFSSSVLSLAAATAKRRTTPLRTTYQTTPQSNIKSAGTNTVTSNPSSSLHDVSHPSTKVSELIIYAAVGGSLLLMVLIGVIYWRYRAQRQGQTEGCERKTEWRRDQETQNDGLCATVNEDKWNKDKETDNCVGLYAAVNKGDKCKKAEEKDDVTYSTVVHNRSSTPATVLLDTEETTEYASIKLN